MINNAPMVRLGELIEIFEIRNKQGHNYPFMGVNKDKMFMPTVADTNELDNTKYKVISKDMFVFSGMQTGRDICIRLALYTGNTPILVSPAYTSFVVKDKEQIIPEFLFLYFYRYEMDRYGAFLSDGSIRSNLDWDRFCDIEIPLPNIETQRALVAVYNGLQKTIADNEALIRQMEEVCHAFVVDCKTKYPKVKLGEWITFYKEKNVDCKITLEQGINISKEFITPQRSNSDLSSRLIVRKGQFAYCTQLNNENVAIAYRSGDDCAVSPVYDMFEINNDKLTPEYLFLCLREKNFGRFVYWAATGSAYEFLQQENLCEYAIPLPPIEAQKNIASIYNCWQESKRIVQETQELMKNLCPALVQKAAHSA